MVLGFDDASVAGNVAERQPRDCYESERSGAPPPIMCRWLLDRLVRLALTATLAFSVAACAVVEEPVVVDSCELVVRNGDGETLEPPYETTMIRRSTGAEEGWVNLSGSGWGMTQFNFAGPGKSLSANVDMSEEGQETNWTATAPGTWHFRVTSGPCTRVFDVEVKPVP